MPSFLNKAAIRKVSFYVASPVETCDRCSAAIKYVSIVTYADGLTQKYGSECINKILDCAPSLKSLYQKNAKLLQKYTAWLEVLSRDPKDMPRGREYFGSGQFFIADDKGTDIFVAEHWFFHPEIDAEKNAAGDRYVVVDLAKNRASAMAEINGRRGKQWLQAEVLRLESFLARILARATNAGVAAELGVK